MYPAAPHAPGYARPYLHTSILSRCCITFKTDVQENLETLLTYTDGTEHGNMAEEHQKELNTRSSTVTPWWWGFKTLVKVCAGEGWRSGGQRAVVDAAQLSRWNGTAVHI